MAKIPHLNIVSLSLCVSMHACLHFTWIKSNLILQSMYARLDTFPNKEKTDMSMKIIKAWDNNSLDWVNARKKTHGLKRWLSWHLHELITNKRPPKKVIEVHWKFDYQWNCAVLEIRCPSSYFLLLCLSSFAFSLLLSFPWYYSYFDLFFPLISET